MGATSIAQYFIGELLHPPRASFIGGFRGITRSAIAPGSRRKIMSNLDKEKREALKKFRGQDTNPDMYVKCFDGSYNVGSHFGPRTFQVMTEEEMKDLLIQRIDDLQRLVDTDDLDSLHDDMKTYLLQCGGAVFEHGHVNGFHIYYSGEYGGWCGQSAYDWEAMQKTFKAQQEQEAS